MSTTDAETIGVKNGNSGVFRPTNKVSQNPFDVEARARGKEVGKEVSSPLEKSVTPVSPQESEKWVRFEEKINSLKSRAQLLLSFSASSELKDFVTKEILESLSTLLQTSIYGSVTDAQVAKLEELENKYNSVEGLAPKVESAIASYSSLKKQAWFVNSLDAETFKEKDGVVSQIAELEWVLVDAYKRELKARYEGGSEVEKAIETIKSLEERVSSLKAKVLEHTSQTKLKGTEEELSLTKKSADARSSYIQARDAAGALLDKSPTQTTRDVILASLNSLILAEGKERREITEENILTLKQCADDLLSLVKRESKILESVSLPVSTSGVLRPGAKTLKPKDSILSNDLTAEDLERIKNSGGGVSIESTSLLSDAEADALIASLTNEKPKVETQLLSYDDEMKRLKGVAVTNMTGIKMKQTITPTEITTPRAADIVVQKEATIKVADALAEAPLVPISLEEKPLMGNDLVVDRKDVEPVMNTPEKTLVDVEKRGQAVAAVMDILKKGKRLSRPWAFYFLMGAVSPAIAQTEPAKPTTTLEQVVTWKDFVGDLPNEKERSSMNKFIDDFCGVRHLSFNELINKYAPSFKLADNSETKLNLLYELNTETLLNQKGGGYNLGDEEQKELSRITQYLQIIEEMVEDHKDKKSQFVSRPYNYNKGSKTFGSLYQNVLNKTGTV